MQTIEVMNLIGNDFRPGSAGNSKERHNPANGQLVSRFTESTSADLDFAVESARNAFEKTKWAEDPKQRARALRKIRDLIVENQEHIAKIQTYECGKVLKDSIAEVATSADLFDYYTGMARNVYGRTLQVDPDTLSFGLREPKGVVGIIVPWNAPFLLLARSLAPALAAGNSILIKPSSYTPATIYTFIERLQKDGTGLPAGIINLVLGGGDTIGRGLAKHPDIDMVSFTGSTVTGAKVMRDASVNIKRLSLELGGKTPNIILEDADVEPALLGALKGSMLGSAGQICFSGTRVMVQEKFYEEFRKRLVGTLRQLKVGDGAGDVDVGPVVSASQLERVNDYIEKGKNEATLLSGGRRLTEGEYSKGFFVEPTFFEDVPPDAKIAQEEIFGPVVSVMKFKDVEEAAEIANRTKYGLSAAIWTKNLRNAIRLAKSVKAGVVWVNMFGKNSSEAESGGYKQSGLGRLRGIEGLNAFTELKTVVVNIGQ